MKNGIFKLSLVNVKSALVYGLLWGLLAMLLNMQMAGSVFNLNWKDVVDSGIMAMIAAVISLLKNLFTTDEGKFVGLVDVVEPK